MIQKIMLRRFKRYSEETFDLEGRHLVLAGPNNCGKTSLLQAVAAWSFALQQWRRGGTEMQRPDGRKHRGAYTKIPVTRQQFSPVALKSFSHLWQNKEYHGPIEIRVETERGVVGVELLPQSPEQIYVRPTADTPSHLLFGQENTVAAVYVPPMTGLEPAETVLTPKKIEQMLGFNQPGKVLRNLLLQAAQSQSAFNELRQAVQDLFHVELQIPDGNEADIIAEFKSLPNGPKFDISSGGSGFQQVLMLLTFLATQRGSVLLVDEPDAHLHVFLQEAIFHKLRSAAARSGSQLIIATHSEVMVNGVDLEELMVLVDRPIRIRPDQVRNLKSVLGVLDHMDIVLAQECPGILYLEDYTDMELLRAWAQALGHPAFAVLRERVYWKKHSAETLGGTGGIKADDHYRALQMIKPDYPSFYLEDGDGRPLDRGGVSADRLAGRPAKTRWRRYEIESYLVHPDAIERFVISQVGETAFQATGREALMQALARFRTTDAELLEPYLNSTKARTEILPRLLSAGGLPAFPYTRFSEIAAQMLPSEVHPEVKEKLDFIAQAFGIALPAAPGGAA